MNIATYWPFGWPKSNPTVDQQLASETPEPQMLTSEIVEANITKAGREAVFSRARVLGWDGPAPLYIWNQIALEVMADGQKSPDTGLNGGASSNNAVQTHYDQWYGGGGLFRSTFGFDL